MAKVCMVAGTLGGAQQVLGEAPGGARFSGKAEEVVGEVSSALNGDVMVLDTFKGGSLRQSLRCEHFCVRLGPM